MELLHPQLGVNPLSLSFITGIGARSPRFPLSKLSKYDDVSAPLRGIPVNGPAYHLPELWPATRAVNAAYWPPAQRSGNADSVYPPLRRYVDSDLIPPMSEPTIAELAAAVVAFGLLSHPRHLQP